MHEVHAISLADSHRNNSKHSRDDSWYASRGIVTISLSSWGSATTLATICLFGAPSRRTGGRRRSRRLGNRSVTEITRFGESTRTCIDMMRELEVSDLSAREFVGEHGKGVYGTGCFAETQHWRKTRKARVKSWDWCKKAWIWRFAV